MSLILLYVITSESSSNDCSPNPTPYLVYIGLNLTFNIFLLFLLKKAR